jgi:hypothetical protein
MDTNLKNKETILEFFQELNKADVNSLEEVLQNYLHQKCIVNISKPFDEYVGIDDFKIRFIK